MSDNTTIEKKREKAFGPRNGRKVLQSLSGEENSRKIMAAKRLVRAKKSKEDLLTFAQFTMPDPMDPEDSDKSKYMVKRHHEALAAALGEVAAGRIKRLIISMPPRHGKTELICKKFIPHYLGNNPGKHAIYATYNENLAKDNGLEVKGTLDSPEFRQVFPEFELSKGGKSTGRLRAKNKSMAYFVGRGGSITGRGGDIIVVDDLFKNDEEADSAPMREKVWKWFTGTIMNRFMTDEGAMILVMTRWHEDDVIGRLTDPENSNYNEEIAKGWSLINVPAIAEENDIIGRPVGEALWPERFGIAYLHEQRALNNRRFSCLYQGNPTPDEGVIFKREWVRHYNPQRLDTKRLRIYVTSDLAVGTKAQQREGRKSDRSVMIVWGLDEHDNVYLLDCLITRDRSDKYVERMIDLVKHWKPLIWFSYQDQITGSLGPYIEKRLRERRVYCHLMECPSTGTKEQKAQPFQARMAMGKVYYPRGKYWANEIVEELIRFPGGKNDDAVDACALFGQNLDVQIPGSLPAKEEEGIPSIGTLAWIKYSSELEKRRKAAEDTGGF
jgi:predicted phage terminase large subunit-like protein